MFIKLLRISRRRTILAQESFGSSAMGVLRRRAHCLVLTHLIFAVAIGGGLIVGIAQELEETRLRSWEQGHGVRVAAETRWRFGGLGSVPPTCRARCRRCLPCRPVQVVVQPGWITPQEYYPQAWRCKCDNKLFMP